MIQRLGNARSCLIGWRPAVTAQRCARGGRAVNDDQKHTPLPWKMGRHTSGHIVDANGRLVANTMGYSNTARPHETIVENEANAALILACVTALAGVPNPEHLPDLLRWAGAVVAAEEPVALRNAVLMLRAWLARAGVMEVER